MLCDEKREFIETVLVIIIFLNLLSDTIQEKRNNHYSFVGSCQVSTVFRHVRSPLKEHINNHRVHQRAVHMQSSPRSCLPDARTMITRLSFYVHRALTWHGPWPRPCLADCLHHAKECVKVRLCRSRATEDEVRRFLLLEWWCDSPSFKSVPAQARASRNMMCACYCCIRSSPVSCRGDATIKCHVLPHFGHFSCRVPLASLPLDLGWNTTSA